MARVSLWTLCAALVFAAGCDDDDDFGRINRDGGPPPDAGPAPNDLPINVGDRFRYMSRSRTPEGCAGGFIDALCEMQGSWQLHLEVIDKVPDRATRVEAASDGSCGSGMTLVEPERTQCAQCPGSDVPTRLNGHIDRDGVAGEPQVYCIPANGWDNVYQLRTNARYEHGDDEHPQPHKLQNSWFYFLAPWDRSQNGPFEGEKVLRTNVALVPRRSPTPFPWAIDMSKWAAISNEFIDYVHGLDPDAEVDRPEGGAYMKTTMNYDLNGIAVRHAIEILYHEKGYLCRFDEKFGPPVAGSLDRVQHGETGGLINLIDIQADPETITGVDTIDGNRLCESSAECPTGRTCSSRGGGGERRCRRLRPKCCTPTMRNCN